LERCVIPERSYSSSGHAPAYVQVCVSVGTANPSPGAAQFIQEQAVGRVVDI
jgi:hypothetical protein